MNGRLIVTFSLIVSLFSSVFSSFAMYKGKPELELWLEHNSGVGDRAFSDDFFRDGVGKLPKFVPGPIPIVLMNGVPFSMPFAGDSMSNEFEVKHYQQYAKEDWKIFAKVAMFLANDGENSALIKSRPYLKKCKTLDGIRNEFYFFRKGKNIKKRFLPAIDELEKEQAEFLSGRVMFDECMQKLGANSTAVFKVYVGDQSAQGFLSSIDRVNHLSQGLMQKGNTQGARRYGEFSEILFTRGTGIMRAVHLMKEAVAEAQIKTGQDLESFWKNPGEKVLESVYHIGAMIVNTVGILAKLNAAIEIDQGLAENIFENEVVPICADLYTDIAGTPAEQIVKNVVKGTVYLGMSYVVMTYGILGPSFVLPEIFLIANTARELGLFAKAEYQAAQAVKGASQQVRNAYAPLCTIFDESTKMWELFKGRTTDVSRRILGVALERPQIIHAEGSISGAIKKVMSDLGPKAFNELLDLMDAVPEFECVAECEGWGLTPAGYKDFTEYSREMTNFYKAEKIAEKAAKKKSSIKSLIKSKKLPTKGMIRYVPPKGFKPTGDLPFVKIGEKVAYVDRFGNQWLAGPSRTVGESFEWDVQLSTKGANQLKDFAKQGKSNKYVNVSLKGKITH